MRKILLFVFIISLPSIAFAQYKKEVGIILGTPGYLGDMGGRSKEARRGLLDLKTSQSRHNLGAYYRYKIKPKVFITATYNHGQLRGADTLSTNPGRNGRRLDFKNNIHELAVAGEYVFYQSNGLKGHGRGGRSGGSGQRGGSKRDFRSYVSGGIAWYHHNPQGTDANGNWVKLQPLGTEGQGTTGKAEKYKLSQFAVPLGAGFNYTFNRTYRVGLELGWRITFTDYLDDASTVYVNPERFETFPGDKTSESYKQKLYFYDKSDKTNSSDVAANSANYGYDANRAAKEGSEAAGEQKRGDSDYNDHYVFLQVKLGYVLKGKSKYYKSKSSYVSRSKYKKRKVRAKF